jgi:hypothetical protein
VIRRPLIRASYSVVLFDAGKCSRTNYTMRMPRGKMKTTPMLMLTSVATRFISPAIAPESLLAFLTLLLNLQRRQKACWYTIRSQINPQAHGYHCSLHPGIFQGIDFLGEREV